MNSIVDINACYKTLSDDIVSVVLEIKKDNSDFEMIFKYTFSINSSTKNSIEIFKDLEILDLYNLYMFLKDNSIYKGIFSIYFKVYQNELNNLRSFAIEKMNQVNIEETKEAKKSIFNLFGKKEEVDTILKVAVHKKECPIEKLGEYANRYVIEIVRSGSSLWETIYSYEFGKYKMYGNLIDVDSVSVYKRLADDEIFKIISLLSREDEYDVLKSYLKTKIKEPHGDILPKKTDEKPQIENIKFL